MLYSFHIHNLRAKSIVAFALEVARTHLRKIHFTAILHAADTVILLGRYLKTILLFVQESYESTKVIDGLWIIPKWRTPPVCLHASCCFFLVSS
jgi:hypothetical protein